MLQNHYKKLKEDEGEGWNRKHVSDNKYLLTLYYTLSICCI